MRSEGLPYLDKVVFTVIDSYDLGLKENQAGSLDAGGVFLDTRNYKVYQHLKYDPDDSVLFACNKFPPVGYNVIFYCNPALDNLSAQEQATTDPGVRQQLFIQIHRIYLTQFPFIVLYSPKYFALPYKRNHNYEPGPFWRDTYNIWHWWCDNGKCSPGVL